VVIGIELYPSLEQELQQCARCVLHLSVMPGHTQSSQRLSHRADTASKDKVPCFSDANCRREDTPGRHRQTRSRPGPGPRLVEDYSEFLIRTMAGPRQRFTLSVCSVETQPPQGRQPSGGQIPGQIKSQRHKAPGL
jgi:hypothetical protein